MSSKKQPPTELSFEQIYDGYGKAISNSMSLLNSALVVRREYQEVALGLAQLAQEEIGKSLSLLSAFHLPASKAGWEWFWSGWRDHPLKAHRAYIYECIHPCRITIRDRSGKVLDAPTMRERIHHEKEASFYVNYNEGSKKFIAPKETVTLEEVFHRVTAVLYLGITAEHVKIGLDSGDLKFNYSVFSEIPFRVCSEEIYQQDMPGIYSEFESRSEKHKELIKNLRSSLSSASEEIGRLASWPV
jgi:AbiV family abortive infection protein